MTPPKQKEGGGGSVTSVTVPGRPDPREVDAALKRGDLAGARDLSRALVRYLETQPVRRKPGAVVDLNAYKREGS